MPTLAPYFLALLAFVDWQGSLHWLSHGTRRTLRPITGYADYYVDAFGFVFKMRRGELVLLRQRRSASGYWRVDLHIRGKRRTWFVHHLVYMTHVRPLKKHEVVHHRDADKHNNFAENLEAMSAVEHNRLQRGSKRAWREVFLGVPPREPVGPVRSVPSYPSLFVGEDGSIWLLRGGVLRWIAGRCQHNHRQIVVLVPVPGGDADASRGSYVLKRTAFRADKLVMLTWGADDLPPKGFDIVIHVDGDMWNCAVENLRYVSLAESRALAMSRRLHAMVNEDLAIAA